MLTLSGMEHKKSLIRSLPSLLKITFNDWMEDNAPRLGAALAYYTVFSLAPLLAIVLSIAGLFYGYDAVQGRMFHEVNGLVGSEGAKTIQSMVASARKPAASIWMTIVGIVFLLFGASGVFGQLKDSLNVIWEVEKKRSSGIWGFIRERFLSFTMVLGVGFLFLVSLILSAAIAALQSRYSNLIPGPDVVVTVLNDVVAFGVITVLLAMLFRYLPDVKVSWRDVWVGAIGTALMMTIGKFLIGMYLGKVATDSAYGAAGSVIIILLWVYYSSQIFLFGAEFTQAYSVWKGDRINTAEDAKTKSERNLSYA